MKQMMILVLFSQFVTTVVLSADPSADTKHSVAPVKERYKSTGTAAPTSNHVLTFLLQDKEGNLGEAESQLLESDLSPANLGRLFSAAALGTPGQGQDDFDHFTDLFSTPDGSNRLERLNGLSDDQKKAFIKALNLPESATHQLNTWLDARLKAQEAQQKIAMDTLAAMKKFGAPLFKDKEGKSMARLGNEFRVSSNGHLLLTDGDLIKGLQAQANSSRGETTEMPSHTDAMLLVPTADGKFHYHELGPHVEQGTLGKFLGDYSKEEPIATIGGTTPLRTKATAGGTQVGDVVFGKGQIQFTPYETSEKPFSISWKPDGSFSGVKEGK